jgi:hypothetical protein
MNEERLIQYQCQKEGSLFYYQRGVRVPHFISCCPICGSTRVADSQQPGDDPLGLACAGGAA